MDKICKIYTDGACSGNPGPGGAAAIILNSNNGTKTITFHEEQSTNQRMEIKSVIIALEELLKNNFLEEYIEIYSDSAYVCNCINQKWYEKWFRNGWINSKKESVANRELWETLFCLLDDLEKTSKVKFIKEKGHSGNVLNEQVDQLAVSASRGEN